MARHKLRDTQIKGLPAGRHGDGDGLWLYVQKSGTRSWVFICIRHGVRREFGLGSYGNASGKISLADARSRADEAREIIKHGGDPTKEMAHRRRTIKLRTFGECADELLTSKENTFRNAKHAAQWKMTLAEYAQPLRKIPVGDVTTDDVVRVLRPLWAEKQETASRLRGRIEKVLDYAKAVGLRSGENPARWKGHLDHILPARQRLARGHHAAMAYADVPAFMGRLVGVDGFGARALELCILTATRSGEVLNAQWPEFDLSKALWTIPAERMKAGVEHVVPLSARALTVLQGLKEKRLFGLCIPGRRAEKASVQHGDDRRHASDEQRRVHRARLPVEFPGLVRRCDKLSARRRRNGVSAQGRRRGRASLSPRLCVGEATQVDGYLVSLCVDDQGRCQRRSDETPCLIFLKLLIPSRPWLFPKNLNSWK
ncbi:tyrosine-type recombinase/integrase [Mesorhizobium caraganae]|uniref:tyrosine-type recombinase/integrase n=1 Tax=Mesorhizobium caraganae TaxID=483206 RepID=UPI0028A6FE6B|nr:integrase arm-type DNA-binding domain-containing protein [Mesorhizobium caraganae]